MFSSATIRVGRFGSVALDIHLTFALVLAWAAWQGWESYGQLSGALYGVLLIALLFACVLLHEAGHTLQALGLGLKVRRILLLPVGGLAELERPPSHAAHELRIAFAGPLTNLTLAAAFGAVSFWFDPLALANSQVRAALFFQPDFSGIVFFLFVVNASLFLFNMLPAFPMDGGRVLRAALALAIPYVTATRIAAWIGRVIAVALIAWGLAGWPPFTHLPDLALILTGIIVLIGAASEDVFVRRRWALARVNAGDVCHRPARTLAPWDTLSHLLMAELLEHNRALPVVVEGRLVGLLSYRDAQRLAGRQRGITVAHVMRATFPSLQLRDTLWIALQEMLSARLSTLPVVENGVFYGVVTLDDVDNAWKHSPGS